MSGVAELTKIIPSSYYYSQEIFVQELEKIFAPNWVFAGMLSEVGKDKDFVTLDLFGKSLVVQNFGGDIKCFQNVCSHRFNKIQDDVFGNRPLLCKYHFWGYDGSGFPKVIPRKGSFDFTEEELECLKLKRYQVDTCGEFVFVCLSNDVKVSLAEYLGEYQQHLIEISKHLGDRFFWSDVAHQGNWKLLIENVLECYHCSSVHASSFFQMGYGQKSPENIKFTGPHSICDFPKADNKKDEKRNKLLAYLDDRALKHLSYKHYFVFPNLVFSSTEGVSFYIGQLLPQLSETTILRIRTFDAALDPEKKKSAIHGAFKEGASEFVTTVIDEDKCIIENIQQGIKQVRRNQIFGKEEIRISAFHEQYLSMLMADNE